MSPISEKDFSIVYRVNELDEYKIDAEYLKKMYINSQYHFFYQGMKFQILKSCFSNKNIKVLKINGAKEKKDLKNDITFLNEDAILKYEREQKMYGVGLLSKRTYLIFRSKDLLRRFGNFILNK